MKKLLTPHFSLILLATLVSGLMFTACLSTRNRNPASVAQVLEAFLTNPRVFDESDQDNNNPFLLVLRDAVDKGLCDCDIQAILFDEEYIIRPFMHPDLGPLAIMVPTFDQDSIMDGGFDEHGMKTILFDEGQDEEEMDPINQAYLLMYVLFSDPTTRGIPDAVMRLAGYPLDTNIDTTMLGGISLRDRYRWNLSITREDTAGDGISDLVKMEPPGWSDNDRGARVYFTITAEGTAEATPIAKGDHVFLPVSVINEERPWEKVSWGKMSIPLGDFRFPLGIHYQPSPVYISEYGGLEFGWPEQYYADPANNDRLGDSVSVIWKLWQSGPPAQIVAGFRGEQHGQRYFFTRWEKMDYARVRNGPLATFEGRFHEDGRIEFHFLEGDFSDSRLYSGTQFNRGRLSVPKEKRVAGKSITFTPHYAMDPRINCQAGDKIPDAWKLIYKINPHCENAANLVFNNKGLTLKQCFEKRLNPWTGSK